MIGDGHRTLKDSTLEGLTKKELIQIIRMLEGNLRSTCEMNKRQYSKLHQIDEVLRAPNE